MRSVDTYLNFNGETQEAFEFYRSVFGGEFASRHTYADFGGTAAGHAESDLERIAHISLRLTPDFLLMGSDVHSTGEADFKVGTNSYVNINVESPEEGRRLFDALSEGGHVEHALEKTSWAEQYGSLKDRFGVQWMFNYWL
ncbi:MAG TPA: VOC family protein [Trueperaceae bacterium]|nr:VOC family protein [Trueperaceae bacterium]